MAKNALNKDMVVIGGSAGSLQVIMYILGRLKQGFQFPLIIVLHRKNDPASSLAEVLSSRTGATVKEAEDKEIILPGIVYIAPADYHLLIENDLSFSLDGSEKVNYSRPSIDVTFQTAAEACGATLTAVLLSGANDDGTAGLSEVRANGGVLIVQDPADATTPYMPQNAIENGLADQVLDKQGIADVLMRYTLN